MVTKKVTLEDLIKRKDELQENKKKTVKIYVESLDGYIVANKPDRALIADAQELDNNIESNIHLVTYCVVEPNLKDKEAQETFGVHTPKELLQSIFNDGEISNMADELLRQAGFKEGNVKLVKDLKN